MYEHLSNDHDQRTAARLLDLVADLLSSTVGTPGAALSQVDEIGGACYEGAQDGVLVTFTDGSRLRLQVSGG